MLIVVIAIACRHPRLASALVMLSSMRLVLPSGRPARAAGANSKRIKSSMVYLRPSHSPSFLPSALFRSSCMLHVAAGHILSSLLLCLAFFSRGDHVSQLLARSQALVLLNGQNFTRRSLMLR